MFIIGYPSSLDRCASIVGWGWRRCLKRTSSCFFPGANFSDRTAHHVVQFGLTVDDDVGIAARRERGRMAQGVANIRQLYAAAQQHGRYRVPQVMDAISVA